MKIERSVCYKVTDNILQIAESREDVQLLKESKEQAVRDKKAAEKRAETAEKQLKSLEERREQ